MANKIKVFVVRALADGFRRAGISFTNEAKRLEASQLSEEQIAAIKAEPKLAVEEVEEDAPAASDDPLKMNKDELAAWLKEREVEFDPSANKTALQALAKDHLAAQGAGTAAAE